MCGDLRGDFFGVSRRAGADGLAGEAGAGVGGKSASIFSTSQDRFSSRNLIRSACNFHDIVNDVAWNFAGIPTSSSAFSLPNLIAASVNFWRSASSPFLRMSSLSFSSSFRGADMSSILISAISPVAIRWSAANLSNIACVSATWALFCSWVRAARLVSVRHLILYDLPYLVLL